MWIVKSHRVEILELVGYGKANIISVSNILPWMGLSRNFRGYVGEEPFKNLISFALLS